MKVYMEITKDKYELPLAIADSPTELARLLHLDRGTVWHMLNRPHKRRCKYIEVEIDDEEGEEC